MVQDFEIGMIRLPDEIDALVEAWNQALPDSFVTSPERLNGYLAEDPNFDPDGCLGAFTVDGELAGFVIGKRWIIPNHELGEDDAAQWFRDKQGGISMIGVKPMYQRKGIGTALVGAIERFFQAHNVAIVSIAREPGRHFLPGVPQRLEDQMEYFWDKIGYNVGFDTAIDIMGDISGYEEYPADNPKLCDKIEANKAEGFDVIGYQPDLEAKLLDFMRAEFPGKWYWRAMSHAREPRAAADELQLLVKGTGEDMEICGFADTASQVSIVLGPPTMVQCRSDPAFGGLGPIGIARDLRGSKGLGAMLLHYALLNLKRTGVERVLIDWTSQGLLDRYYGPAGFNLYMRYVSSKKELEIGEEDDSR